MNTYPKNQVFSRVFSTNYREFVKDLEGKKKQTILNTFSERTITFLEIFFVKSVIFPQSKIFKT